MPILNPSYRRRTRAFMQRAADGLALVMMHELDALSGHLAEIRERLAVARHARGVRDLIRTQIDLFPETRARLSLDHQERRALLHSWFADVRGGLRSAA